MRAVIIANGQLNQPAAEVLSAVQGCELLIAADGGARHCLNLDLLPQVIIGDMDSISEDELATLQAKGVQIIRHPTHKDYTDLELALNYAQERGASEILILAALGARWDQTIANILLVAAATFRISLLDAKQAIYFIHGGQELELHGVPGDIVSLIPLAGDANGITTRNLEYALTNESLFFGSTRGVSNVLLAERASVSLGKGLLMCTVIHNK